jgi:hypothetical protein
MFFTQQNQVAAHPALGIRLEIYSWERGKQSLLTGRKQTHLRLVKLLKMENQTGLPRAYAFQVKSGGPISGEHG